MTDVGSTRAAAIELFWSVQGEGRHVGVGMAFLRLATCPIRCVYCDTPGSYVSGPEFEVTTFDGRESKLPNPLTVAEAVRLSRDVGPDGAQVGIVSVTGGEPLAQPKFVAEFGGVWRQAGGRVHLETAALDAAAMDTVLPVLDHVSADYKLPGTLQGGDDSRQAHLECFERVAARGVSLDVKMVLTPAVQDDDVLDALSRLAPFRQHVLLVLQPVTPFGAVEERFDVAHRGVWMHQQALLHGFDVRVLPQVHKLLGVI